MGQDRRNHEGLANYFLATIVCNCFFQYFCEVKNFIDCLNFAFGFFFILVKCTKVLSAPI